MEEVVTVTKSHKSSLLHTHTHTLCLSVSISLSVYLLHTNTHTLFIHLSSLSQFLFLPFPLFFFTIVYIPLYVYYVYILCDTCSICFTLTFSLCLLGLNFINILRTALTRTDPKSIKRYWWLKCIFYAFGINNSKSCA